MFRKLYLSPWLAAVHKKPCHVTPSRPARALSPPVHVTSTASRLESTFFKKILLLENRVDVAPCTHATLSSYRAYHAIMLSSVRTDCNVQMTGEQATATNTSWTHWY